MALPSGREIWIWFDLVSIPQRSRDLQIKAISSLCCYTQLCTRCVTQGFTARFHVYFCTHGVLDTWVHCALGPLCAGLSPSCATPMHGPRSTVSPSPIARCPRARCRSIANEGGAGESCCSTVSVSPRGLIQNFTVTVGVINCANCAIRRLEVLAALTPKKFWRGDWRPGPRNIRFRYHVRR